MYHELPVFVESAFTQLDVLSLYTTGIKPCTKSGEFAPDVSISATIIFLLNKYFLLFAPFTVYVTTCVPSVNVEVSVIDILVIEQPVVVLFSQVNVVPSVKLTLVPNITVKSVKPVKLGIV